jgi:phosphoribosylformimino-5-aminoimidazole carboxamide ribotide isomerase
MEDGLTSGFDLLPAIDLRGGRVVRLREGDFARETAYSDDPLAVAVAFAAAGTRWLHVVDLDGARTGTPVHGARIGEIVAAVGGTVNVEVAGGLRTAEAVASALDAGAARIVVGTAAIRDPSFAATLIAGHGSERIAAAIDVRDGRASGEGWDPSAPGIDALDAIGALADAGIETFEVTAIDRDGLLSGPDLDLLGRAVALDRGQIIASAGISSIKDLTAVIDSGCAGAIVGRALYEGRLDLRRALEAVRMP